MITRVWVSRVSVRVIICGWRSSSLVPCEMNWKMYWAKLTDNCPSWFVLTFACLKFQFCLILSIFFFRQLPSELAEGNSTKTGHMWTDFLWSLDCCYVTPCISRVAWCGCSDVDWLSVATWLLLYTPCICRVAWCDCSDVDWLSVATWLLFCYTLYMSCCMMWLQSCGPTFCGILTICRRLTAVVLSTLQSALVERLIDSSVLLVGKDSLHLRHIT